MRKGRGNTTFTRPPELEFPFGEERRRAHGRVISGFDDSRRHFAVISFYGTGMLLKVG
jgi:hypothetical protein